MSACLVRKEDGTRVGRKSTPRFLINRLSAEVGRGPQHDLRLHIFSQHSTTKCAINRNVKFHGGTFLTTAYGDHVLFYRISLLNPVLDRAPAAPPQLSHRERGRFSFIPRGGGKGLDLSLFKVPPLWEKDELDNGGRGENSHSFFGFAAASIRPLLFLLLPLVLHVRTQRPTRSLKGGEG